MGKEARHFDDFPLEVADRTGLGNAALGESFDHVQGSADQVSQIVGQVRIYPCDHGLLCEVGVDAKGHVAQQVVAK